MTELEQDIKRTIADHTYGISVRSLPRRKVTHARVRRAAAVLTAAVAVIAAGTAGFAAVRSQLQAEGSAVAARGSQESASTDVQDERPVASGTHGGARWALFADRREQGSGAAAESLLCMRIDFGDVDGDALCNVEWNAPPTEGFVAPVWYFTARGPIVIYGAAQEPVETVELTVNDHPAPSRVYEAPAELASTLDFFVGFVPPGTQSVQLVARDAAGNELESRDLGPRSEP